MMSRYNILKEKVRCPYCKDEGDKEIFIYFGKMNCIEYKIGDKVEWAKFDSVKQGGRPEQGSMISEGYAECNNCSKDFAPKIIVENDIIERIDIGPL